MAREQRNDVDYFPHQCTHGRKMHIIETKYGNDGYASWHKLLEELGKANFHYIDISDEMTLMYLVSVFKVEQEKAISILQDLAKLGAIDKYLYEEKQVIYSQKFVDSVRDAYRKRKSEPLEYSDVLDRINTKNVQSGGRLTEETKIKAEVIPKEKKSKEKEIKEEERERRALAFLKTNFPSRYEQDFLMKYGTKIRDKNKFAEDFNDTVDQEKLEYSDRVLFGRLGKYARNWIENQNKYSKTPKADSYESGKQKRF